MPRRIPTLEDYCQHDGLHYRNLWKETSESWACPACKRTRFQIMRWAKRFPNSPNSFYGWIAPLHRHHDHSVPMFGIRKPRFPETVLCDQCNSADGAAKRRLGLPENFSFSPEEIGKFVTASPHERHKLDLAMARSIHTGLSPGLLPAPPWIERK
jgi:hypothetical protein